MWKWSASSCNMSIPFHPQRFKDSVSMVFAFSYRFQSRLVYDLVVGSALKYHTLNIWVALDYSCGVWTRLLVLKVWLSLEQPYASSGNLLEIKSMSSYSDILKKKPEGGPRNMCFNLQVILMVVKFENFWTRWSLKTSRTTKIHHY